MLGKFKAYQISALNALTLILIGGYGYLQSSNPSPTALIPVIFGVILLAINKGLKKENKVIAHIAVLLTFLILIGLVMPLNAAIERGDSSATMRVSFMVLTTIIALAGFVKSFVDARKNS